MCVRVFRRNLFVIGIILMSLSAFRLDVFGEINVEKFKTEKVIETDIQAYIDGKQIQSYNIGGSTVVVCHDLANYGFEVVESNGMIFINSKNTDGTAIHGNLNDRNSYNNNIELYSEVSKSDTRVFVNNILVPSYRIDNKIVICLEDLNERVGCKVQWHPADWTIEVMTYKKGDIINSLSGKFEIEEVIDHFSVGEITHVYVDGKSYELNNSKIIRLASGLIKTTVYDYLPLDEVMSSLGADSKQSILSDNITFSSPESVGYRSGLVLEGFGNVECIIYSDVLYVSTDIFEEVLDKKYIGDLSFVSKENGALLYEEAEWIYWKAEKQNEDIQSKDNIDYWIDSTVPACPPSGRGVPALEPYFGRDEVSITFVRDMDFHSNMHEHFEVIRTLHGTGEIIDVTDNVTTIYEKREKKLYFNLDQVQCERYDTITIVIHGIKNDLGETPDKNYKFAFTFHGENNE